MNNLLSADSSPLDSSSANQAGLILDPLQNVINFFFPFWFLLFVTSVHITSCDKLLEGDSQVPTTANHKYTILKKVNAT